MADRTEGNIMLDKLKATPAKTLGLVSALLALLAVYVPGLPQEAILGVVATALLGGYQAQKIEDRKTEEALEETPDLEGFDRQLLLLLEENAALRKPSPSSGSTQEIPKVTDVDLDTGTFQVTR
ncbi:hypothetical protein ABZ714_13280 [Streptomyces sp. NPDC006798]|uniref:hypothetical protein n=1 Tax=Streptomyces sp. NPDC006798 TaxID=3155462 RepID=UPI0033E33525